MSDETKNRIKADWGALPEERRAAILNRVRRGMRSTEDSLLERWLASDDASEAGAFADSQYPLRTDDPVAQERANRSFNRVLESYKEREGLDWEEVAQRLGRKVSSLASYRTDPSTTPRDVVERLCSVASVTVDELRGCGDDYNKILRDGTSCDALLAADLLAPEHVQQLYAWADEDAKKAVTLALQGWLQREMLSDQLGWLRLRDGMLKSAVRRRLMDD